MKSLRKNNWLGYLYILPLLLFSTALIYYCMVCTGGR